MSESDFELSDLDDPLQFLDSPSWSQRFKSLFNSSKNRFKKLYYTTPFDTGIELHTWNDGTGDFPPNDGMLRNGSKSARKRHIWQWISLVLALVSTLLLTILIISSVKKKKSYPSIVSDSTAFNATYLSYRTLIVSLDGFHPGYINSEMTPFLHSLFSGNASDTISTPFMLPSYPSQTFPNHWSMVTGNYPQHHGIIANKFWDPIDEAEFGISDISDNMNRFWNVSYPLWYYTNLKNISTYTHMWPGSELTHEDALRNPTRIDKFQVDEPLSSKLEVIKSIINNNSSELTFAYVPVVDTMGHKYGNLLEAGETDVLTDVDQFIEQLVHDLNADNLNIVIVSDHGMSTIKKENVYIWEDLFGTYFSHITKLYDDTNTLIYAEAKDVGSIFEELSPNIPEHCELLRSSDLFSDVQNPLISRRIAPLWITCEPGYLVVTKEHYNKLPEMFGTHGFRRDHPDMRSFFLGKGPFFKDIRLKVNDRYVKPFDNIQIFSLLLQLANITDSNSNIHVDADLKFWEHLVPLGKFSEDSEIMAKNYPGSTFNTIWNTHRISSDRTNSEHPNTDNEDNNNNNEQTGSDTDTEAPSSEGHKSFGEILNDIEDSFQDILNDFWPSKGDHDN